MMSIIRCWQQLRVRRTVLLFLRNFLLPLCSFALFTTWEVALFAWHYRPRMNDVEEDDCDEHGESIKAVHEGFVVGNYSGVVNGLLVVT
jgi:hypothetical protein